MTKSALAVLSLSLIACGGGSSPSKPSADMSTSSGPPASAARTICNLWVSCVSSDDPDSLPAALSAYGPSGTCWQDSATENDCGQACASELQEYGDCPSCNSDAECYGAAPVCCGQMCSDLKTDALNCGACGTACTNGVGCSDGVCSGVATSPLMPADSCMQLTQGVQTCSEYKNFTTAEQMAEVAACMNEGATVGDGCPTGSLIGCCTLTSAGLESEACYYAGALSDLMSACNASNGTWATTP